MTIEVDYWWAGPAALGEMPGGASVAMTCGGARVVSSVQGKDGDPLGDLLWRALTPLVQLAYLLGPDVRPMHFGTMEVPVE